MVVASTSRSPPMSTSPFPPPSSAATGAARSPTVSASTASFLRDIADATEQRFGTPNALPGPPPSHFFPSVPRAQREKARQARLASASPPPPPPLPKDYPPTGLAALAAVAGAGAGAGGAAVGEKSSSPELDEQDQEVLLERQRQAKVALAASGPFDNRRPSAVSVASTGSGGLFSTAVKSVGTGGSGGTKRRHRDEDRTSWDAASELVRLEREKEKAVFGGKSKGKGKEVVGMDEDQEKTPTPSVAASFSGPRPVSLVNGAAAQNGDSAMAVDEGEAEDRPPPVPSKSLSPELDDGRAPSFVSADTGGEEDDELADGDDAMTMDDVSIRSGVSGMSKATGADEGGNEPAKKRSRTLTTPAQTAVLNALLAKTRFPSTETREEVGKQIGMSARRVQIWFQNRRQSQKRQRDREAQEAQAAAAAGHALSQHHLLQQQHFQQQHPHLPQPAYQHAYAQHAHIDPYSAQAQAAHLYAPVQLKPHDPYSALPHPHQHPHLQASSRPDLHHRISADSIASRASLAQSQHSGMSSMRALSTHGSERDGLGPLPSETRMAHPAAYASSPYGRQFAVPPHPSDAGHLQYPLHLQQQQQPRPSLSIPSKLYFPHVPRPHPHGPPGRLRVDSYAPSPPSPISQQPAQNGHGEQVKLPSLSAILSPPASAAPSAAAPVAPAPAPPPPQQLPFSRPQIHAPLPVPVSHEAMFSHSPFSPPPTHATLPSPASSAAPSAVPPAAPSFPTGGAGRALFSPEPSASSFERLRISGGPLSPPPPPSSTTTPSPFSPLSPSTAATTPSVDGHRDSVDILDVAVETMAYRPSGRHLPARQVLPPLRSVLGDTAMNAKRPNKGGHSEADKALLAPILPSAAGSSSSESAAGPPRLAPISTFAPLTAPSPPTAHSTLASPASTAYPPAPPPPVGSTPPQPSNLRASTWSANSHATTATRSTADFDFAHPPSGSYRAAERAANGSGWAGHLLTGGGGGGGGGGAGAGAGVGPMRERNGSTATSARTSVSSEVGK